MDKIEKLVKDLVDIALTNNKALASGSFKLEDTDKLEEAITLNNYVLRTFTSLGSENEDNISEDDGASGEEVLSEDSGDSGKEGIKVTRTGNLESSKADSERE
jgi:hypothetical protein